MYVPTLCGERFNDPPTVLYATFVRQFVIVLTRSPASMLAAWAYVALVAVLLPRTLGSAHPFRPAAAHRHVW